MTILLLIYYLACLFGHEYANAFFPRNPNSRGALAVRMIQLYDADELPMDHGEVPWELIHETPSIESSKIFDVERLRKFIHERLANQTARIDEKKTFSYFDTPLQMSF